MSNEVFKGNQFEVPHELAVLPSNGMLYSQEHPLCNAESVEIKCMTAKEEDLLSSRALLKNGTALSRLIQACIINKAVDPDSLLTADRNAILVMIRITGYGPEYSAKVECPECGETFDNTFTLNQLPIKRLGAEPLQPNTNAFKFTLPLSKDVVHFKLLTGKDEFEMSREQEAKKKKLGVEAENVITSRLYHSILSVNGESDSAFIAKKINSMRAADAKALRNYMDKIEPELDMRQKATCPHCSVESEVNISLGISFFWPDFAG